MEESTRKKQQVRIEGFPIKSYDTASCTIDGETLIVHATNQKVFTLNASGTRIWELADGFHSIVDIARVLKRTSKKSEEQLRKDVERFIVGLVNKRVLVVLGQPLNITK